MSCGQHSAINCNQCPYNGDNLIGQSWCNGDCHWKDDECIPNTGRQKSFNNIPALNFHVQFNSFSFSILGLGLISIDH